MFTGKRGQMIVEYAVMFAVIVAVVIYAAITFIKPSLNGLFIGASRVINTSTDRMVTNF